MKPSAAVALVICACLCFHALSPGQEFPVRFRESFDTVAAPRLPGGWTTTASRNPEGDFLTTSTGAASPPACALSSNATVAQSLTSPALDLTGWRGCILSWNERRSASHDASVDVGVSSDGGATFVPATPSPLPPPGGSTFVARSVPLPAWTEGLPGLLVRWTVAGDGTGATGTIRLDDIVVRGRPALDLSITADTTDPRRPLPGEDVRCSGSVLNTGSETATGVGVRWAVDSAGDGAPAPGEFGPPRDVGSIDPGDSARYSFVFRRNGRAALNVYAVVVSDSDMVAFNDTALVFLPRATAPRSVVINEILYDPLPGLSEYVELYNRSAETIDLAGWRLVDGEADTAGGLLAGAGTTPGPGPLLPPGGYLLCSPETTLARDYPEIPPGAAIVSGVSGLSLNNGGDLLILLDESGGAIDRVEYSLAWHTPALDDVKGRSLERIDPAAPGNVGWNWGTSAGPCGGTPGAANSLAVPGGGDPGVACVPNPFSPDGDGFEDATVIAFRSGNGPSIARARIYDAGGALVRTLTSGEYMPADGSFAWNGYDDRGRRAPIGMYIVVVDLVDGSGKEATALRAVVVLAGKL